MLSDSAIGKCMSRIINLLTFDTFPTNEFGVPTVNLASFDSITVRMPLPSVEYCNLQIRRFGLYSSPLLEIVDAMKGSRVMLRDYIVNSGRSSTNFQNIKSEIRVHG